MKVATRLVLTFSVLTAVALFLVSSLGYFYTAHQLTESIQNEMREIVNTHVSTLDGWLDSKVKILDTSANTVNLSSVRKEDLSESHFSGFKRVDEELSDLYFGTVDGRMIDGSGWIPPADYDPRNRPWYRAAVQADKMVFTDPYVDMTTGKMAISVAMPIKDEKGKLIGVLAEDILLDTIKKTIDKINLRGQGNAFLLDSSGLVLIHPDGELVLKNVAELEGIGGAENTLKELLTTEQGFVNYKHQGVQKIMFYQKIPISGWTLGVAVPMAVIYQPLEELRHQFTMLTLGVMLLVIGVCLYVAREITKPMLNLTRAARQIADGNWDVQTDIKGKDPMGNNEIAQLAREFNLMARRLAEMMEQRDQAARELQAAHDQLEEKVETRTQELVAANEELQAMNQEIIETMDRLKKAQTQLVRSEKMAALGGLVGGMAHEINTPVGVAVTAASHLAKLGQEFLKVYESGTMKRKNLVEYITQSQECSDMVVANLKRAAQLIGSFKTVSIDQASEERRTFKVKEYLTDILVSLQPKLRKTKHTVTIRCEESLEIYSYPGAFAQIITNLLMNSLTHAYEEETAGQIVMEAQIQEDKLELIYIDDGKGMDEQVLGKIFDPFFTTARGAGGTGLGLYLVYHIVTQQFGGTIECNSALGAGTSFMITVPCQKEPKRA